MGSFLHFTLSLRVELCFNRFQKAKLHSLSPTTHTLYTAAGLPGISGLERLVDFLPRDNRRAEAGAPTATVRRYPGRRRHGSAKVINSNPWIHHSSTKLIADVSSLSVCVCVCVCMYFTQVLERGICLWVGHYRAKRWQGSIGLDRSQILFVTMHLFCWSISGVSKNCARVIT